MELKDRKCVPCEGGVPSLSKALIDTFSGMISPQWKVNGGKMLIRKYDFVNFRHTMSFVNKVADIAEQEGHHPDIHIYYAKCILELWTHAIGGLSENDFILAAKIDRIK
jgi:4a-hydroxytetrahydrobiopterin dehydratase